MEKTGNCRGRRTAEVEQHSSGKAQCVANKKQSGRDGGTRYNCRSAVRDKLPNLEEEMERNMKVLKLVTDLKLTMTQINGQRRLGPPADWQGPSPGAGCEVFVGKIPRTLYEHDIYPVFRSVGEVFEIRLMMDFSGTNRGYCFVMYTKPEYAARAVKELDQFEIQPGKKIGVVVSINNCRLYIGQLPADIKSEAIIKRIYEMTDEVEKVAVYRYANGRTSYALVSYATHRGAAMARRRLVPETRSLLPGSEVTVEWAHPNMSPVNVYEDCGTYDKEGKLEIRRVFVRSAEGGKKNSAGRRKENRGSFGNGRKCLSPIGPPKRESEAEGEAGHKLVPRLVGSKAIRNNSITDGGGYRVVGEIAQHRNTLEWISENYMYQRNSASNYMEILLRQQLQQHWQPRHHLYHHHYHRRRQNHRDEQPSQEDRERVSLCKSASFEFVNGYLPGFPRGDAALQHFPNVPFRSENAATAATADIVRSLRDQDETCQDLSNCCEVLSSNAIDSCPCCVSQRQMNDFAFGNALIIPRIKCQEMPTAAPIAKPIAEQVVKPIRCFNAFPQALLTPPDFASGNCAENSNLQIPRKYCRPILCRSRND